MKRMDGTLITRILLVHLALGSLGAGTTATQLALAFSVVTTVAVMLSRSAVHASFLSRSALFISNRESVDLIINNIIREFGKT